MPTFTPDILQGQVALVTGGGTGIGKEIARTFGRHGARLCIAARRQEVIEATKQEFEQEGLECLAVPCDVRQPDQVEVVLQETLARFGRLDVLVNNAAGNFVCPAERMSSNAWRAVLGIVLDGTFYCSKAFGKQMMQAGDDGAPRGGSIVNIIATYAWTGMAGVVHSASAKAGVLAMSKSLAMEWARFGIRNNCVAPGPFLAEALLFLPLNFAGSFTSVSAGASSSAGSSSTGNTGGHP